MKMPGSSGGGYLRIVTEGKLEMSIQHTDTGSMANVYKTQKLMFVV